MKKIINSILAFVTLFSVTSCDLDMDPETAIRPEDAYTMEYCEGVRGYVYVDLKALLSGSFYSIPDLYVDVLNVCIGSGNQGIYPFNWRLYPTDQVFPIRKSGSRKRNWLAVRWQSCMRT